MERKRRERKKVVKEKGRKEKVKVKAKARAKVNPFTPKAVPSSRKLSAYTSTPKGGAAWVLTAHTSIPVLRHRPRR